MTYEIEYDCDRCLFKITLHETYTNPNHQEQFAEVLARIVKTINPMPSGIELAEHIKNFKPLTREERLHKAIDCEDTKLLQQQFPDSTLIDANYLKHYVILLFRYLETEDVKFLFEFGLLYDYNIEIQRTIIDYDDTSKEGFTVNLREID